MSNKPAPAAASSIAKPNLRGLHNVTIKRNLAIAVGITAIVTLGFKIACNDPTKAAYAEFYKNYDAQKSFERMRANGRFQSC